MVVRLRDRATWSERARMAVNPFVESGGTVISNLAVVGRTGFPVEYQTC